MKEAFEGATKKAKNASKVNAAATRKEMYFHTGRNIFKQSLQGSSDKQITNILFIVATISRP